MVCAQPPAPPSHATAGTRLLLAAQSRAWEASPSCNAARRDSHAHGPCARGAWPAGRARRAGAWERRPGGGSGVPGRHTLAGAQDTGPGPVLSSQLTPVGVARPWALLAANLSAQALSRYAVVMCAPLNGGRFVYVTGASSGPRPGLRSTWWHARRRQWGVLHRPGVSPVRSQPGWPDRPGRCGAPARAHSEQAAPRTASECDPCLSTGPPPVRSRPQENIPAGTLRIPVGMGTKITLAPARAGQAAPGWQHAGPPRSTAGCTGSPAPSVPGTSKGRCSPAPPVTVSAAGPHLDQQAVCPSPVPLRAFG